VPYIHVFVVFLKLGLTSFGGPIAHLAFFRTEFVVKRRWINEAGYAELVALCQFLPGPTSSQVGFALGLMRAGPLGALAAFAGFTLPSMLLMIGFALGGEMLPPDLARGVMAGLLCVAVAVVADAVLTMARTLCPDPARAGLAIGAAVVVLLFGNGWVQMLVIAAGALAGTLGVAPRAEGAGNGMPVPLRRSTGVVFLGLFAALFVLVPLISGEAGRLFAALYQSGALVFGGGHVVLPLLEQALVAPGLIGPDLFLSGYAAAQALPGPLFSFAAYLGTVMSSGPGGSGGPGGAVLATVALFLPGFLVLLGVLPFWHIWRRHAIALQAVAGANAAVVGVLGAALYTPVFTSAAQGTYAVALSLAAFGLLRVGRVPPGLVVLFGGLIGLLPGLV
jgi:chromate transporter